MVAAFGAAQAVGQVGAEPRSAAAPAPVLDYDSAIAGGQPAGGNVAAKATSLPADVAEFNPASDEGAMTVLSGSINGNELRGDTIVTVRNGQTLVPVEDLKSWRLLYSGTPITIDGQAFVALTSVPGLTFKINKELQQLQLTVPIEAFEATTLSGQRQYMPPSQAARTAFLNYDLTLEHASGHFVGQAFLETGASDDLGLVENTMTVSSSSHGHNLVRLDTYAIHDDPSGLTRLTFGDTLTHPSTWGQQVRFGGVKWGTDFSLQPGFLSFPTPTFNGQAALPSNVQLYVNDVLNYQGQVQPGPFALNRLPVVSGAGDVSVVVKDALGVEHRVTSSYYVSTDLLRPGLSDFSLEAGAERYHYGFRSFDYGRPFVAGSFRYGLTSNLTVETRGEAASNVQDLGGGIAALIGNLGQVGIAGAASKGPDGSGYLYRVYAARLGRAWSFSVSYQANSRNYAQLGFKHDLERPRETLQASVGANSRRFGSLTANISYLRLYDGARTRIEAINYNRQIGAFAYLGAFALRTDTDSSGPSNTFGASLSIPLGRRRSAFVQVDNQSRRAELQQTLPDDKGWGYRLVESQGEPNQQEAELDYRGRAIDLSGTVSRFEGQTAERALVSGALILSGSTILPTRRLNGSFAIVDVGRGEKVRVFQENREVATTNGAGLAIVTNLRPYEANGLAVAPDDLKLESTIQNPHIMVVPRFLSGVKAHFQVTSGHAGTVVVMLPNGQPLEPGLSLSFSDGAGAYYSGFDGEVFVDDIKEGRVLVANRAAGPCRVILPAVPKGVELPRIGPLTCLQVEPAK